MSGHLNVNKMEIETQPTSTQSKQLEKRNQRIAASKKDLKGTDGELLNLCTMFQPTKATAKKGKGTKKRKTDAESKESLATMAFGIYEVGLKGFVITACQNGADLVKEHLPTTLDAYKSYELITVPNEFAATGLHAEMMIVRYLMTQGTMRVSDVTGTAQTISLRIGCPGKLVCPDCSGWLKKHGIPHYPPDAGKKSPNWVNPRTGACFRFARGQCTFYQKHTLDGKVMTVGSAVDASIGNLTPLPNLGKASKS